MGLDLGFLPPVFFFLLPKITPPSETESVDLLGSTEVSCIIFSSSVKAETPWSWIFGSVCLPISFIPGSERIGLLIN